MKKKGFKHQERVGKGTKNTAKSRTAAVKAVFRDKKSNEQRQKQHRLDVLIATTVLVIFGIVALVVAFVFYFLIGRVPVIKTSANDYAQSVLVSIEKDAKMFGGLDHYRYCVTTAPVTIGCDWKDTYTKSTVVDENGVYHVYFAGVDKNDKMSPFVSSAALVKVDNQVPVFKNISGKYDADDKKLTLKVTGEDNLSGVDYVSYSIDHKESTLYSDNGVEVVIDGVEPKSAHALRLVIRDNAGNEAKVDLELVAPEKSTNKFVVLYKQDNGSSWVRGEETDDGFEFMLFVPDTGGDRDWENVARRDRENGQNGGGNNSGQRESDNEDGSGRGSDDDGGGGSGDGDDSGGKGGDDSGGDDSGGDDSGDDDEKDSVIPKINLDKVPLKMLYGEKYELPSEVSFGTKGGTVQCAVDDAKNYTNTNQILPGSHNIECTAKGKNGLSASVSRNVYIDVDAEDETTWDGWVRMNLYYPENSINWQWKILGGNLSRDGEGSGWTDYVAPVVVRLTDVSNIVIRYTIGGKVYIKGLNDTPVTSIEPENDCVKGDNNTRVEILYSDDAELKQYRINGGAWRTYEGEFLVPKNTQIESRAVKTIVNKNPEGEIISSYKRTGTDSKWISECESQQQLTEICTTEQPWVNIVAPHTLGDGQMGTVNIYAPEERESLMYTTDGVNWQDYTGSFEVGVNTVIGARSTKEVTRYNCKTGEIISTGMETGGGSFTIGYAQNRGQNLRLGIKLDRNYLIPGDVANVTLVADIDGSQISELDTAEYSLDNGVTWNEYVGEFSAAAGTNILARATKSGLLIFYPDGTVEREYTGTAYANAEVYYAGEQRVLAPAEPIIAVSPEKITTSVTVTITPPQASSEIYYSLDGGDYKLYTEPFELTENTLVRAYYISDEEETVGQASVVASRMVDYIDAPSVAIYHEQKNFRHAAYADITIGAHGHDGTIEYSLDGQVTWQTYGGGFRMTQNGRVWARVKNYRGVYDYTYYDVTNIGEAPALKTETLNVYISAEPNPDTMNGLIGETTVSISCDTRATKCLYKLDERASYMEYTGPFTLDYNATVYAYAENDFEYGKDLKQIDFLTTGISSPVISATPRGTAAYEVDIDIAFDKNATKKLYSMDGGSTWVDYEESFTVDVNNITICAKNINVLGDEAMSCYTVDNIVARPIYTVIDGDGFYILYLRYPYNTTDREYKWQANGVWKEYDEEKGLILVKESYRSRVESSDGVKVEVDGREIIYTDHYYFIADDAHDIFGDIFMRWEKKKPPIPEITRGVTEIAKEVPITIDYGKTDKKYYMLYYPDDGTQTRWMEYKAPFMVTRNKTIVYAYSISAQEVKSEVAKLQIDNIDKGAPEIEVRGDFETPTRRLNLTLQATDDNSINYVSYAKGVKDAAYFVSDEADYLPNNSLITIGENGVYSMFAIDLAGNTTVKTFNVSNIDLSAPDINIVDLTGGFGTETIVEIVSEAEDVETIEYRLGSCDTWYNYTSHIVLRSSKELASCANSDNSLTVVARMTDTAGNTEMASQTIYSLDLDYPNEPEIFGGTRDYPTLTMSGVKAISDGVKIVYDNSHNDMDNYYSLDSGDTWHEYNGPIRVEAGSVMAKSVKRSSGLTVSASVSFVKMPDALGPQGYDGNTGTYAVVSSYAGDNAKMTGRINIDESMWGEDMYLQYGTYWAGAPSGYVNQVRFFDEFGVELSMTSFHDSANAWHYGTSRLSVPEGSAYMIVYSNYGYGFDWYWYRRFYVYEIGPWTTPDINAKAAYPTLTAYSVETPNNVTIDYAGNAVHKLYKTDDSEWTEYDGTITLQLGETLYAKSVDANGIESPVASYTSTLAANALGVKAYDSDSNTYAVVSNAPAEGADNEGRIYLDDTVRGETLIMNYDVYWVGAPQANKIAFYDANGRELSTYTMGSQGRDGWYRNGTMILDIPANAEYMSIYATYPYQGHGDWSRRIYIHNIEAWPEPKITAASSVYPTITADGVVGSTNMSIHYVKYAVEKLYKIDNGEWKKYTGAVKLNLGETIYAKSVDGRGVESTISSYKLNPASDGLGLEAYDGDDSTGYWHNRGWSGAPTVLIDESAIGKTLRVYARYWHDWSHWAGFRILDANGAEVYSYYVSSAGGEYYQDRTLVIPEGAAKLQFGCSGNETIFEVQVAD